MTRAKAAVGVLLVVVAMVVGLSGAPASADPPITDTTVSTAITSQSINAATTDGGECVSPEDLSAADAESAGGAQGQRLKYLPLNRWGGATSSLHSRLDTGIAGTGNVPQRMMRGAIQPTMMSIGDAMWSITGGLVTFASEYSVLDKAGCTADAAAASLGTALMSGLVPIFAGVGLILLFWKAARSGNSDTGKQITRMVVTLGVFAVLLNGASKTAATGTISPGSPAYLAVTMDGVVTAVAAAPTAAMNNNMPTAQAFGTTGTINESDATHCSNYIAALRDKYSEGSAVYRTAKAQIPMSISAMWEQSGLMSFVNVQFGSKNPYGQASFCRYLDRKAGIRVEDQQEMLTTVGGPRGGREELFAGTNNNTEDQAGVFWAACQYNGSWSVRGEWEAVTGSKGEEDHRPTAESCEKVWAEWGAKESNTGFEWSDSPTNIEKRTDAARSVRNFMLTWHGDSPADGLAVSVVYVISSVIVLLVFGLISIGIIIAKSVGVVMVVMVFLMLAVAMLPSQGETTKLVKFFKFWLGMTFYSAGLMFILGLVALITSFVNQVGLTTFGAGSLMSILWMGFAPVTAIVLLHVVFRHAVGVPSPFKPGSALAYGGMAAGAGAALGVGLDRSLRRGRGMASGYARGMARGHGMKTGRGKTKPGDQRMPTGGRPSGAAPAPGVAAPAVAGAATATAAGGAAGAAGAPAAGGAGTERLTMLERAKDKAARTWAAAKGAPQVPLGALSRAKERWNSDGGRRRLIKRTVGAGAVSAAFGAAATGAALASPAAPVVAAAIGAKALMRARKAREERIATGESQTMREASRSRSNARIAEQARRRREEAERRVPPPPPAGSRPSPPPPPAGSRPALRSSDGDATNPFPVEPEPAPRPGPERSSTRPPRGE